jgi:hypothetical protein
MISLLLISLLLRHAAASGPFTDTRMGFAPNTLVNVTITADENPRLLQTVTQGACAASKSQLFYLKRMDYA